jgi:hypothetical protein
MVFPTLHTSGVLRFKHGDQEWGIDSSLELADLKPPAISCTVFFSDVKHEVLPATSGHRVTVTHNLCWNELDPDLTAPPAQTMLESETPLASLIQKLPDDPSFLPWGRMMGFGLQYQYASEAQYDISLSSSKGADATLRRACYRLELKVQVKAAVQKQNDVYEQQRWLMEDVPSLDAKFEIEDLGARFAGMGTLIEGRDDDAISEQFAWVTGLTYVLETRARTSPIATR